MLQLPIEVIACVLCELSNELRHEMGKAEESSKCPHMYIPAL